MKGEFLKNRCYYLEKAVKHPKELPFFLQHFLLDL